MPRKDVKTSTKTEREILRDGTPYMFNVNAHNKLNNGVTGKSWEDFWFFQQRPIEGVMTYVMCYVKQEMAVSCVIAPAPLDGNIHGVDTDYQYTTLTINELAHLYTRMLEYQVFTLERKVIVAEHGDAGQRLIDAAGDYTDEETTL